MVIDVLINSCARPDILEKSIFSFLDHIKTTHKLNYILIEDKVNDEERQALGRDWINKNIHLFDDVVWLKERAGPGYFFAPAVSQCLSGYFFHLEDDNEFIEDIDLDPIVELMQNNQTFISIMLARYTDLPKHIHTNKIIVDNQKLTEFDSFSVATGLFNAWLVRKIIDSIGWEKKLNEHGTLRPMADKFGYRRFIYDWNKQHYIHLSEVKGYRKGSWK